MEKLIKKYIRNLIVFLIIANYHQVIAQITCKPNITHVSCLGSTNGSIVLTNVTGGTSPYTYTWQPGSTNSSSITSKGTGAYTVTVKGTGTLTSTYSYNIGYKVKWQNMYNTMSQSNDTLKHGSGASSWLYAANSSNLLNNSTDGWVEYVISSMDNRIFGLADSGSAVGWNLIDYGIILNSGGTYNTCNNGSQVSIGSYVVGDVMRVERSGSNMIYKKNGTSVWSSTITAQMQQSKMYIGGAVWATGGKLENVGCSFQSVNVTLEPYKTIDCYTPSSTLTAYTNIASANYSWTPGGSTPTASSTAVSSSDTYYVKVTEPFYGCTVTAATDVYVDTSPPSLTITNNPTITCSSPTVVITSSRSPMFGTAISWSPGGATTSSLAVTAPGTYTLNGTNILNGCSTSKTVSITSNTTIPTLTITNSPTITCTSPTVVITSTTSTSGVTYSWSPGGATTSSLSTSTAGTYTLKVTTTANGCSITKTVSITSNTTIPTLTITNSPTITCTSPTVVITSTTTTGGVTYSWSPGGATTPSLAITAAGTYSLKVTNPVNGCSITKTVSITSNTTVPTLTITNSPTITCSSPTVVITSTTSTGGVTYSWSPGGITTSSLSTSTVGTYTLKITNTATGCITSKTVSITSNTTIPTLTITNSPTVTCSNPTVVVTSTTSTGGATYSWSPGGATTSSLSTSTAGTYSLKVTNPVNGCSITKTVSITSNTTVPTLTITNSPTITCSSPTVVITSTTSTSGATYSWSPGGITTYSLSTSTAGTYTLKVTNPTNGCMSLATLAVTANTTISMSAGSSQTITCTNTVAVLTGSSSTSGVTYSWSPGGITTSTLSTSSAGTYTLKVTNPITGCSSSATVAVITNTDAPIVDAGPDQIFVSASIPLGGSPTASSGTSPYTYTWTPNLYFAGGTTNAQSNPSVTPTASTLYTLTVEDANGCIASDFVFITNLSGNISYAILTKAITGSYINPDPITNKVYFKFEEEYKGTGLKYKIYDYNSASMSPDTPVNLISCSGLNSFTTALGGNRYYIDITGCGSFITDKIYLLEVTNSKNEKFYLKFKA